MFRHTLMVVMGASVSVSLYIISSILFSAFFNQQDVRTDNDSSDSHIMFVGDVLLARDVEILMRQNGAEYPFSHIAEYLTADIIVGNFEASVPEVHTPTPHFNTRFSVDESLVPALRTAGFTHLSLANNHAYDYGIVGFHNTQSTFHDAKLVSFGDPLQIASTSISYVTVRDTRIAILGLSAVDTFLDPALIAEIVDQVEETSDIQIAYVHWGSEYELRHNESQTRLAHVLIDSGIDLIIGHHPHVVQDIEVYNGVPVFYSLGNFIFDQYFSDAVQKGLILELSIKNFPLYTVTLIPVSSELSRTAPQVLGEHEKKQFLKDLAARSTPTLHREIQSGTLTFKIK